MHSYSSNYDQWDKNLKIMESISIVQLLLYKKIFVFAEGFV